jgi:hypothetical protein
MRLHECATLQFISRPVDLPLSSRIWGRYKRILSRARSHELIGDHCSQRGQASHRKDSAEPSKRALTRHNLQPLAGFFYLKPSRWLARGIARRPRGVRRWIVARDAVGSDRKTRRVTLRESTLMEPRRHLDVPIMAARLSGFRSRVGQIEPVNININRMLDWEANTSHGIRR